MNAIDSQISEYREKLSPSLKLISDGIESLKSPDPLPENDVRRVAVEVMDISARRLSIYLNDPEKYCVDLAKARNLKHYSLHDVNPSELPSIFCSDIKHLLSGILNASILLLEFADDVDTLSKPLTTTEKESLSEILTLVEKAIPIIDDITQRRIDQHE